MAVLNDYECEMHGHFEAFDRKCPYGCSRKFVKLVFLKPVGTRSGKTKWTDNELNQIAKVHGLTNIKGGDQETSSMTRMGRTGEGKTNWLDVPHNSPGWSQRGDKPATFDLGSITKDPGAVPVVPDAKAFRDIPRVGTRFVHPNDGFTGKL
jgi:hypothetical protein